MHREVNILFSSPSCCVVRRFFFGFAYRYGGNGHERKYLACCRSDRFLLIVYFAISLILFATSDRSFGKKGIRARDDFLYRFIKNWIVSLLPFLNSLHNWSKY